MAEHLSAEEAEGYRATKGLPPQRTVREELGLKKPLRQPVSLPEGVNAMTW
jgi:hypothetical protein